MTPEMAAHFRRAVHVHLIVDVQFSGTGVLPVMNRYQQRIVQINWICLKRSILQSPRSCKAIGCQARHAVRQAVFTHRRFYTQTLLHADAFYTRTHAFTHRRFYTQTLLHTDAFTHRRFYTQMLFTHAHTLSHTNAFAHRRFTDTSRQRRSYTQTLLHTNAYTHRGVYTHRHFYTNESVHRNFSSVFDVQRPFRAKGLRLTK